MRPLRRHLIESGFDGLVWQAGWGNPVAGGNFMIEGRLNRLPDVFTWRATRREATVTTRATVLEEMQ